MYITNDANLAFDANQVRFLEKHDLNSSNNFHKCLLAEAASSLEIVFDQLLVYI